MYCCDLFLCSPTDGTFSMFTNGQKKASDNTESYQLRRSVCLVQKEIHYQPLSHVLWKCEAVLHIRGNY